MHNAAWGVLGAFTATSYPVIVNKYLVGDFGVLILVGAVKGDPDVPRPRVTSGQAPAV